MRISDWSSDVCSSDLFALHGNWVGIDGFGRALLGAALFANFGGPAEHESTALLGRLADNESLHSARFWGLSLRLGMRITGGPADELKPNEHDRGDGLVLLKLTTRTQILYGEANELRNQAAAK